MLVPVVVASKHGATTGLGEAVARTLEARGIVAPVREAGGPTDLAGVDAVIVGSAVYMGRWLEPARTFLREHAAQLVERPVWLFSSGPLGDPPTPAEAPDLSAEIAAVGAREHRVFAGSLDKKDLGIGERTMVRVVHAPEGDFRDWAAVTEWAEQIADALLAEGGSADG